jgi:hypothetical protein
VQQAAGKCPLFDYNLILKGQYEILDDIPTDNMQHLMKVLKRARNTI